MVRCSLACPHTVASIILIKVIRFLGLSPNCGRVLEDSVSTAIETATISFDKKPLRDMENPVSKPRKSMVRIGAITGIVIKLGLYQLCFLAMILLVGLSTFSKSPPIGGETCVQIVFSTVMSRLRGRSKLSSCEQIAILIDNILFAKRFPLTGSSKITHPRYKSSLIIPLHRHHGIIGHHSLFCNENLNVLMILGPISGDVVRVLL